MRCKYFLYIIVFLSFFSPNSLFSSDIFNVTEESYDDYLGRSMYFSSFESDFDIEGKKDVKYTKSKKVVLNLGVSDKWHLVRIKLKNLSVNEDLFLQTDNGSVTILDAFIEKDGELISLGEFGKYDKNMYHESINIISIPFHLEKGKECTIYLKTHCLLGLSLPFRIQSNKTLIGSYTRISLYSAFFFGAMFVMLFYNLFIFFQTKDKNYLRYSVYTFGMALYLFSFKGYLAYFIDLPSDIRVHITYFLVNLALLGGILFGYFFLSEGGVLKWARNIALGQVGFIVLSSVLYFYNTHLAYRLIYVSTLFHIFFYVVFAIAVYKKGFKTAIYFAFAQFIMFVMILLTILRVFTIVPFNFITFHLSEIGTLLDVIIFSFALASRIKILDEEKNKSQLKLLEMEKNATKVLEQKVEQRTEELNNLLAKNKILFRELHHRVKNNLQTISSLLNLQADRIEDEKTIAILSESRSRIHSMALIHQKLYQQEGSQKIDLEEYIKNLSDFVNQSFNNSGKKITIKIKINYQDINIDLAINIGLILNELLTNSFKHAFAETGTGEVEIWLDKDEDFLKMTYKDSGKGYDFEKACQKSFGIKIIKMLVSQLKGHITMEQSKEVVIRVKE